MTGAAIHSSRAAAKLERAAMAASADLDTYYQFLMELRVEACQPEATDVWSDSEGMKSDNRGVHAQAIEDNTWLRVQVEQLHGQAMAAIRDKGPTCLCTRVYTRIYTHAG